MLQRGQAALYWGYQLTQNPFLERGRFAFLTTGDNRKTLCCSLILFLEPYN